jgi:cysteine desulfurase/selenocysteine lyase
LVLRSNYVNSVGKDRIRAHESGLVKYAHEKLRHINSLRIIGNAADKARSSLSN